MTEYVYVVTNTELGWDCVIGVNKTNEGALRSIFCDEEHEAMTEDQLEALYSKFDHCCHIKYQKLEN